MRPIPPQYDLAGKRFGKLTVQALDCIKHSERFWRCLCDCGTESVVYCYSLTSGNTKSCGSGICQMKPEDSLIGKRFGKLVAREYVGVKKDLRQWRCECDCGNERVFDTHRLNSGTATSCGCGKFDRYQREDGISIQSLVGQRFGKLVVEEFDGYQPAAGGRQRLWKCKCDCGSYTRLETHRLTSGGTKSCGCGQNARVREARLTTSMAVWRENYNDGDLTWEEFHELSQLNCHYCGTLPSNSTQLGKADPAYLFTYSGLDRVDSNQAHNLDNVVPCCYPCNWSKSNLFIGDWMAWIARAYKHSISSANAYRPTYDDDSIASGW